uniref:flagellinolysin n=1 Tax=Eubacterium cellulosolvens TaxID=29322 RepID=UPI000685453F|nr:flagellinolysin [[Eubacterium] cellulosolvens]
MVLQHNLPATTANRHLTENRNSLNKSLEKLSSGFRINRAADDAAGLAISEAMRSKINGLTQAEDNAKDGIGLIQTTEGALTEVHSMLQRGYQLSVQAANGTYNDNARKDIDLEIQELKSELNRISENTDFNGIKLLQGTRYPFSIDKTSSVDPETLENIKNAIGNSGEAILKTFSHLTDLITSSNANPTVVNGEIAKLSENVLAQAAGWVQNSKGYIDVDVDTSKFGDSAGADTAIQATIAHEMMHGIMGIVYNSLVEQNHMSGVSEMDTDNMPLWFIEGTAQVAGGIFNAGWNSNLRSVTNSTSTADVKALMASHQDPANEPYGMGALAVAYMGHKASGETTVSVDSVVKGLDKIFEQMKSKNFNDAVEAATTKTTSAIFAEFTPSTISDDAANFVKAICNDAGGTGGGSFLKKADGSAYIGLNTKVTDYGFTSSYTPGNFTVNFDTGDGDGSTDGSDVMLQIGATKSEVLNLHRVNMSTKGLGITNSNVLTQDAAKSALESFQNAIDSTSTVRGYYGAVQNRLEHTINNLQVTSENTTAAESRIRDTDMAKEMAKYTKSNILMQAAQSMLAQANQSPQGVLSLLQG